ncbi:dj-1 family protein [Colletotrichum plurivorum]|uniref:Dj-1 family protein n=1 Tax=Colletotrichum plurivorum TaxID=2175906 RepID=A0A8H6N3E0_9PEZI|nr:dj-1 family protein [Colletotrichum plurivorum]
MMIRSRNITISILSKRPTTAASASFFCARRFSQSSTIMAQNNQRPSGSEYKTKMNDEHRRWRSNTRPGKPVNFGIVVFPAFQALDAFGPLDALNLLSRSYDMNLYTIAETLDPVSTKIVPGAQKQPGAIPATGPEELASDFGQTILPTYTFQTCPPLDVLIVPGGQGTRYAGIRSAIDFVRDRFPELQYLITVCTGSGVAARAGVLDGRRATTNKISWESTIALRPEVNWVHRARWVQDGNVWTSSGISAGIDVTFAWIGAVYGKDVAKNVAKRMEYTPVEDANDDPFADLSSFKK